MEILIAVLSIFGGIFFIAIIYFCFIEQFVDMYKDYRYRKTTDYWTQKIYSTQHSWNHSENFEKHCDFTLDFLRNTNFLKEK